MYDYLKCTSQYPVSSRSAEAKSVLFADVSILKYSNMLNVFFFNSFVAMNSVRIKFIVLQQLIFPF